ncbi:MAG: hypothetical protein OFPII_40600 [Osedax symbiont Rs1]|nr:MAG: hypothetical protein OFPII_40600 [Osedax symbiont Rs1]
MTSLHHIAQALDSTAVRKIATEATGFMHGCIYLANAGAYELAAKIFQFHRRTNILHSAFTLKSRIQVLARDPLNKADRNRERR